MASSRFVNVSDEDISQFLEENENKNKARKTSQDVACSAKYIQYHIAHSLEDSLDRDMVLKTCE